MTAPQSNATAESSLGRDVYHAARYYLGNRWTLVAVAGLAVVIGLYFGGWGWLVAAGLVPILLSTLPCLVMCVFGVCMMCRSEQKQSPLPRDAEDPAASPTAIGAAKVDRPTTGSSSRSESTDRPKESQ